MDKDYALYKGEQLLSIGTLEEIAESLDVQKVTLKQYLYPSYQKRSKKVRNTRALVCLSEE